MQYRVAYSATGWRSPEAGEGSRMEQVIIQPLEDGRRIVVEIELDPWWPEGVAVRYAAIEKPWVDRQGRSKWRIAERLRGNLELVETLE